MVNPGQLTVGAVAPLDEPYFVDGEPGNGEGFESALVYAVADGLGLRRTQVTWRTVGPDDPLDPAAERVDFLVGRIAVDDSTDARAYSQSYLQVQEPAEELVDADGQPIPIDRAPEETAYALAFAPGDPLVICVDGVLGELVAEGGLQELADTWLASAEAPAVARVS